MYYFISFKIILFHLSLYMSRSLTPSLFLSVSIFLPLDLYRSGFVFLSLSIFFCLYLCLTGSVCLIPLYFWLFFCLCLCLYVFSLYLSDDDYNCFSLSDPSMPLCICLSVFVLLYLIQATTFWFMTPSFIASVSMSRLLVFIFISAFLSAFLCFWFLSV